MTAIDTRTRRERVGRVGPLLVWAAAAVMGCDVGPAEDDADASTDRDAIPDVEACDDVRDWPRHREVEEAELARALDIARARAVRCPTGDAFAGSPSLDADGALRCAARNLALHLAEYDTLTHRDGEGGSVVDRIAATGRDTVLSTELVAAGDVDASRIVDELWRTNGSHCAALFADAWTDVGVAYVEDPVPAGPDGAIDETAGWGAWWVVVLATPAR